MVCDGGTTEVKGVEHTFMTYSQPPGWPTDSSAVDVSLHSLPCFVHADELGDVGGLAFGVDAGAVGFDGFG